jgi:hypothetical protein
MQCKERKKKPGDYWPVRQSYHYPLPIGLDDGTLVKLLSYDHGYWTVEADGKQFVVFGPQVDAGYLYELSGRWLPADDPRVIARKKEETLLKSPAYSCVNGGCMNLPI